MKRGHAYIADGEVCVYDREINSDDGVMAVFLLLDGEEKKKPAKVRSPVTDKMVNAKFKKLPGPFIAGYVYRTGMEQVRFIRKEGSGYIVENRKGKLEKIHPPKDEMEPVGTKWKENEL